MALVGSSPIQPASFPHQTSTQACMASAPCSRVGSVRGALLAAKWVKGRRGWFDMHDVLGLDKRDWRETDEFRRRK